jgi:flagellar biosynthesis/type III secretory pathway protein FliH
VNVNTTARNVNCQKEDSSELELLIQMGLEREGKEREDLEKKYTVNDVEQARVEGYQEGLNDGFASSAQECYDKGWSEGYDTGFKSGYSEAKQMSEMYAQE